MAVSLGQMMMRRAALAAAAVWLTAVPTAAAPPWSGAADEVQPEDATAAGYDQLGCLLSFLVDTRPGQGSGIGYTLTPEQIETLTSGRCPAPPERRGEPK